MSSIFDVSFAENMRRLASERARKNDQGAGDKPEFSSVLAELEKHQKEAKETGVVATAPRQIPVPKTLPPAKAELLSNFTPGETEQFISSVSLEKLVSKVLPEKPEICVNEPKLSVKAPAISATSPGSAPKAPVIQEVRRLPAPVLADKGIPERRAIEDIIMSAGREHGVDPSLGLAIAHVESALDPEAVSKDGHFSKGIFQLLDSTAHDLRARFKVDEAYNPFDPKMNARLGVGYLRHLHDIFSEETNLMGKMKTVPVKSAGELEKLAVAAFNAGQGNVAQAQRKARRLGKDPTEYAAIEPFLPASTRAYVARVTNLREQLAKKDEDSGGGLA